LLIFLDGSARSYYIPAFLIHTPMHSFHYKNNELHCEDIALTHLAKKFGSPLYVYSKSTIINHYKKLDKALSGVDHQVCFAMKANSNLAVLKIIAELGGGFDVVSAGEIFRVEKAGGDLSKCVFAGVGKTSVEIEYALKKKISCFNIESEPELERINVVAKKLGLKARVAVRVNPNVEAGGHKKISTGTYENKFGIAFEKIRSVYARAAKLKNIEIYGLQMHIGSRIPVITPYLEAVKKIIPLVIEFKKKYPTFKTFDIGGGIEIVYNNALESGSSRWWDSTDARKFLTPAVYAKELVPLLKPIGVKIIIEPGRFIVGNAGVLLTNVEYVKKTGSKNFVIVDAAMNDLIRPALYESYHEIVPVQKKARGKFTADIVGPVCESGDCFAHDRAISKVGENDLLAIMSAGAYGFVMAGNYNSRPLPAEILVDGKKVSVIRSRQTFEDLIAGETLKN